MASESSEKKMSLKIFIDKKLNKVVFGEAGNEFVDFLFQLMHLPLSSVTKLLKDKQGMVGCFEALYKSIECLDDKYYKPKRNKDSVLKPRTPTIVPLLSFSDSPTKFSFYRCCISLMHDMHVSDCKRSECSCGKNTSDDFSLSYVPPTNLDGYSVARYVKGAVPYVVMDNLEVKPMSISVIKSLVRDFDSLEEKHVEFGPNEGLALLKASLQKEDVLTTVFLINKI